MTFSTLTKHQQAHFNAALAHFEHTALDVIQSDYYTHQDEFIQAIVERTIGAFNLSPQTTEQYAYDPFTDPTPECEGCS